MFIELIKAIDESTLDDVLDKDFDSFKDSITTKFKSHFPNGLIEITKAKSFGDDPFHINITMGMIGNPKDTLHGIAKNDLMRHTALLYPNKDGETYKFSGDGRVYINPKQGSHNAMDGIKTELGNASKVTLKKAEDKIIKFIPKLAQIMKDNIDNIYKVKEINPKYLEIK